MASSRLMHVCWFALAVTFPLFGVQFFRYNEAALEVHIAAPMIALILITVVGAAEFVVRRMDGPAMTNPLPAAVRPVLWCGYAFLAWHAFGIFQSPDVVLGLREFYKIALGLLCLTVVVAFFPRDEKTLANFWIVVIWSTTALLGFLIYQSIQLNVPYLVSELGEVSRAAKNQLAGFMVYAFPFVVGYVSHKGRGWMRPLQTVPALVFSVALLYNGSRGGWVAATCSLIVVMAMSDPATRIRRILISLVVTGLAITGAYYCLEVLAPLERLEYYDRVAYFYDPDSVPQFDTWNERSTRVFAALEIFRQAPIIGVGLGSTGAAIGTLPHNDYILILGDLGAIGLLLFLAIIVVLLRLVMRPHGGGELTWLRVAWRAGLVGELVFMLTMDRIYSTTLFWAFVGLALVAVELETASRRVPVRQPAASRPRVQLVGTRPEALRL